VIDTGSKMFKHDMEVCSNEGYPARIFLIFFNHPFIDGFWFLETRNHSFLGGFTILPFMEPRKWAMAKLPAICIQGFLWKFRRGGLS